MADDINDTEMRRELDRRMGIRQDPPPREIQAFDVVSRTTATRDIDGAFNNLEAFLAARPWRDHGEAAQLRRARRMVELLVNGQVAAINQHSPDEYSEKVQAVERLMGRVEQLQTQLHDSNQGWADRVQELEARGKQYEALAKMLSGEVRNYRRLYQRATTRLKVARRDRRQLRATLIGIGELVLAKMDWGSAKKQAPKEQAAEATVPADAGGGPEANYGVGPGLVAATPEPLLRPSTNKPPQGLA